MMTLDELKPAKKINLIDLVNEAGHDVSDWERDSGAASNNPKYCYEWCFYQENKDLIINFWHERMYENDGEIFYKVNYLSNIEIYKAQKGKQAWVKRARACDTGLRKALEKGLPIRVVIQSGKLGTLGTDERTRTEKRVLDPVYWNIKSVDYDTGEFILIRSGEAFIDQFEFPDAGTETPGQSRKTTKVYDRDPEVRKIVLRRANGFCEYCGAEGFETPRGKYLETHHIIPLSENGPDTVRNVIALCPNDHRKAHYWIKSAQMREQLFSALEKYDRP